MNQYTESFEVIAEMTRYQVDWRNVNTGDQGSYTAWAEDAQGAECKVLYVLREDYHFECFQRGVQPRTQVFTVKAKEVNNG